MNNKLEDFIRNNKKQFETEGPSDLLWNKITADLQKQKASKITRLYRWASIAALLIISVGMYFGYRYKLASAEIVLADINPRYGQKATKFTNLIEEKRDSLQIFAAIDPELYQKFTADLLVLEQDYQELKKQLQNSPNRALVVKAMIKNLETQLQVITQQLNVINQVNEYKKETSI